VNEQAIFHLAIPINDVAQAKQFYGEDLGCDVGRENPQAVIFNFYGTQLVAHTTEEPLVRQKGIYPRHLGLILPTKQTWQAIADRAQLRQLSFYKQPTLRFPGKPLEHYTFFLEDPFYNLLEFKYYLYPAVIFGGKESTEIGDRRF
jgi:hypothetical protein